MQSTMVVMWNLWTAIDKRISSAYSPVIRDGIVSTSLLIRSGEQLRWSDLELMVIPALRAFGLDASLHFATSASFILTPLPAHPGLSAAFCLSESPQPQQPKITVSVHSEEPTPLNSNPKVLQHALVKRDRPRSNRSVWQVNPSGTWVSEVDSPANSTWAILSVQKASRSGLRGANITQALLRMIAFADANPDRLITAQDVLQAQRMAEFLMECAGRQSNLFATRIRRAAESFHNGNIDAGLYHLKESVLLKMGIPVSVRRGLLRSLSEHISDIERSELIYLARAATPELKVMAIRRLATECNYKDVLFTMEQLRHSSHSWVRSAAELCSISDLPRAVLRRIGARLILPLSPSLHLNQPAP